LDGDSSRERRVRRIFFLSYKFGALGLTQFLGLRTEGDDYRRFIPLMNVTPAWEPVVSLLASAFYLAAMVLDLSLAASH
jgi:hypothetical protein